MRTKSFKFWLLACTLFFTSYLFWINFPILFSFLWIASVVGILLTMIGMVFVARRINYGAAVLSLMVVISLCLLLFQDQWQKGSTIFFLRMHRTDLTQLQLLLQNTSSPITVFDASVLDPLNQLDAKLKAELTSIVARCGIQFVARHEACLSIPLQPDLWQSKRLMLYDSIPHLQPQALQITPIAYLFDVSHSAQ
jgi:hypothetical protein